MKKLLFIVFLVSCFAVSTATAQVSVFFSTSSTDSNAGNLFNIADGGSVSLFVWVENNDASGNAIDGLSLDISASGPLAVSANAFNIENPSPRWAGSTPGVLGTGPGLIVDESNAIAFVLLGDDGIQNGVGPKLHAELNVTATGAGVSTLTIAEGSFLISVEGQSPQAISFQEGFVAVPEPSSLGLLGSLVGAGFLRRRRG